MTDTIVFQTFSTVINVLNFASYNLLWLFWLEVLYRIGLCRRLPNSHFLCHAHVATFRLKKNKFTKKINSNNEFTR